MARAIPTRSRPRRLLRLAGNVPKPSPHNRPICSCALTLALAACLIFLAAFDPGQIAPSWRLTWPDKLQHFCAYALIATLALRAFPSDWGARRRGSAAVLTVSLLGLLDESLQTVNPARTGDALDWLADLLGASCAVVGYLAFKGYTHLLEKPLLSWLSFVRPSRH